MQIPRAIAVVTTNTMMNRLILESIDGEMDEDLSVWPRSLAAIDGDSKREPLFFSVTIDFYVKDGRF